MSFRCIMIESSAHLYVRNEQLLIRTDAEHSIPLEDISALMLENRQSVISVAALSRLGQNGCAVYVCDEKHIPCAVLEPYQQHSRALEVLRRQIDATEPMKKRLWQKVVKAKIRNQARCLDLCGMSEGAQLVYSMVPRVRSGDTENVEAVAAQTYFRTLFGNEFSRGSQDGRNAGLNYGYAILRGYVARTLSVYGLIPTLGIHHCSTLNAFNLADDLMEPFRPIIDLLIYNNVLPDDELNPEIKRMLFNCLNLDVISGGKHYSAAYAIERMVHSLSRVLSDKTAALELPELVALAMHRYE